MIKITPEELVRYLYQETSEQKTAQIRAALQTDWNLRDTYEKLLSAHKSLDEVKRVSPRESTINSILEYAAKKQVQVPSR